MKKTALFQTSPPRQVKGDTNDPLLWLRKRVAEIAYNKDQWGFNTPLPIPASHRLDTPQSAFARINDAHRGRYACADPGAKYVFYVTNHQTGVFVTGKEKGTKELHCVEARIIRAPGLSAIFPKDEQWGDRVYEADDGQVVYQKREFYGEVMDTFITSGSAIA